MVYNTLRYLLYPAAAVAAVIDQKKREFLKKRVFQNIDMLKENQGYIWVHCSSVGEVNLSEALVKKMLERRNERVLLTVFTDTGYETAKARYGQEERVDILYFPLDEKGSIKKILKRIELKLLVIVETEIWPNLIKECSKRGKVIFVNGRISDKSFRNYKKLSHYLRRLFRNVEAFYMQTHRDAGRIIEIGAQSSKVEVVGNLKFDIELAEYSQEEREEYKNLLGLADRKIFVAGSTRKGEDQQIIDVFKKMPNYSLIIVPRHLERIPEIEELLKKAELKYRKYSEPASSEPVVLVDQMGVLRKLYAVSDTAFVGGTLVDIGGHSLLEPLFYGKTPIFGPYFQNVRDIANESLKRDIGYLVKTPVEFLNAVKSIEENAGAHERIAEFFAENRAVVKKILDRIDILIN